MAQLRDRNTPPILFRSLVHDLSRILFLECVADLRVEEITVATPLADCSAHRLRDRVGLMPVLRAGLGMADAIQALLPEASVWHLGLYRDHDTCQPVTYYNKLPHGLELDVALILDPMLATGGSAIEATNLLKKCGLSRIRYLGLIAAPEGVQALTRAHADVPVYLAAIDSHLDENNYIIPGLGDAGDRQFGT
jgi:uracil phosphoribosyltransferase